jgi:hypothetical protein
MRIGVTLCAALTILLLEWAYYPYSIIGERMACCNYTMNILTGSDTLIGGTRIWIPTGVIVH